MKKIIYAFMGMLLLTGPLPVVAQHFSVQQDTVWANVAANASVTDKIFDTTPGGILLKWHVLATNFPADWLADSAFKLCDNNNCYGNDGTSEVWNTATGSGNTFSTYTYYPNQWGDFHLNLNLNGASNGTHYITVGLQESAGTAPAKSVTFMVTNGNLATPAVPSVATDVTLYPNPATSEINVVYDATADVKTISLYNVIGKVMAVYKVSGNSANLTLENVPSGVYFARLINGQGEVVGTRKFTKQ